MPKDQAPTEISLQVDRIAYRRCVVKYSLPLVAQPAMPSHTYSLQLAITETTPNTSAFLPSPPGSCSEPGRPPRRAEPRAPSCHTSCTASSWTQEVGTNGHLSVFITGVAEGGRPAQSAPAWGLGPLASPPAEPRPPEPLMCPPCRSAFQPRSKRVSVSSQLPSLGPKSTGVAHVWALRSTVEDQRVFLFFGGWVLTSSLQ